jgi:hypothetical protein
LDTGLAPYMDVKLGFREGNLDELQRTVLEPVAETNFPIFVKLLAEANSGIFFMKKKKNY